MYTLISRPQNSSMQLASTLEQYGVKTIIEPLINIKYLEFDSSIFNESNLIIAITSAHAIKAINHKISKQQLLICVGQATSIIAKKLGFTNIITADNNVLSLINLIKQQYDPSIHHIIYPRSDHITIDLVTIMQQSNFKATSIIVYHAMAAKDLSHELIEIIKQRLLSNIVLFSKRSAVIFIELIKKNNLINQLNYIKVFALSKNIATICNEYSWQQILIAKTPSQNEIIKLLKEHR